LHYVLFFTLFVGKFTDSSYHCENNLWYVTLKQITRLTCCALMRFDCLPNQWLS